MAPSTKEQSQGSRSILSIKLLAPLVGIVCLGIALLIITPSYAASGPSVAQLKVSGGGCTTFGGKSKVCVNAKKGQAVSTASVNQSPCPKSVEIKLFDNSGLVASTKNSGCGNFKGPAVPLKAGNEYVAQVIIDGSAVPSPRLKVS
jgi:hypothetical protein